jgi:hypothetical protein
MGALNPVSLTWLNVRPGAMSREVANVMAIVLKTVLLSLEKLLGEPIQASSPRLKFVRRSGRFKVHILYSSLVEFFVNTAAGCSAFLRTHADIKQVHLFVEILGLFERLYPVSTPGINGTKIRCKTYRGWLP